jgi:hypothetical protein
MSSVFFQQRALGADARASRTVIPAALNAGGEEMSLPICVLDPVGKHWAHADALGATLAITLGAFHRGNSASANGYPSLVNGWGGGAVCRQVIQGGVRVVAVWLGQSHQGLTAVKGLPALGPWSPCLSVGDTLSVGFKSLHLDVEREGSIGLGG